MAPPHRRGGWSAAGPPPWRDSDANGYWKCCACGCGKNLARYWFCKQCHGKRKEVEAAAPQPPSGGWAAPWADWDKWAASGATSAALPVGLQGGTSPPPVAGDEDKLSEEELLQFISLHKKMGNSSAATALQHRLDKRRVGDAPVPLQAQAYQVDRHIKQLEKKLQHDLDQYTKWQIWLHDKKESIGSLRRELAAEVGKYQSLVEQLRTQVCPPPAAQPKARVSLQDLLSGESDFLDMSNMEEVFGIDSSVYEVQEADAKELEKRTTQLKEAIQASARQLFGEAKKKFDELKKAHAAHVGKLGKKRKVGAEGAAAAAAPGDDGGGTKPEAAPPSSAGGEGTSSAASSGAPPSASASASATDLLGFEITLVKIDWEYLVIGGDFGVDGAMSGIVQVPGAVTVLVSSVYPYDSEELTSRNLDILAAVSARHSLYEGPNVIGGDFTMIPDVLVSSGVPGYLKANVIYPDIGTCSSTGGLRVLDYFVLSSGFTRCIQEVTAALDSDIKTHTPARILFRPQLAELKDQEPLEFLEPLDVLSADDLIEMKSFLGAYGGPSADTSSAINLGVDDGAGKVQQTPFALGFAGLRDAWTQTLANPPAAWRQVRGPIGAMFLSLKRIGWSMPSYAQMTNDLGVTFSLATSSPRLIKNLLREAVIRQLCRLSGEKLGVGARLCYDSVIRDLSSSKYTPFEKGSIRANVCGACWTKERATQCGYQLQDTSCALCGGPSDSMFHRLWVCLDPEVAELRQEIVDPDVLQAANEIDPASCSMEAAEYWSRVERGWHPKERIRVAGLLAVDIVASSPWCSRIPICDSERCESEPTRRRVGRKPIQWPISGPIRCDSIQLMRALPEEPGAPGARGAPAAGGGAAETGDPGAALAAGGVVAEEGASAAAAAEGRGAAEGAGPHPGKASFEPGARRQVAGGIPGPTEGVDAPDASEELRRDSVAPSAGDGDCYDNLQSAGAGDGRRGSHCRLAPDDEPSASADEQDPCAAS
ncbi:unnamed protein product [Prorocentrum cordatum]|uniref:RanBP2-type domain-containing protein n=1 Tax=Prorocentrum cordatum TaxID=2364126 RepID=A0ABN9TG26_9DINO|nr:unnamed protein product [Polarella glacialis]